MTRLQRALLRLELDLRALRVDWAIVGGLAVAARAEPRTTRDVDVAVAVRGDDEAESLVRALLGRGYMVVAQVEQDAAGRLGTMRLSLPDREEDGVVVDLLFASSGIEAEVVAAAELLEIGDGILAPIARIGHLLALKALAGRPLDLVDFKALLLHASEQDLPLAREAVDLISRRGFDRQKNLPVVLEELLREAVR